MHTRVSTVQCAVTIVHCTEDAVEWHVYARMPTVQYKLPCTVNQTIQGSAIPKVYSVYSVAAGERVGRT